MRSVSEFLVQAFEWSTQVRALKVAFFVGTILGLLYQGPDIFGGGHVDWLRLLLTYLVPYCVATVVSVSTLRQHRKGK